MTSIIATNHTSFTVSNLDGSRAFFRDALGFEITSKAPRAPKVIERDWHRWCPGNDHLPVWAQP
jgi:catechol 2,3-dioxygenase-like lactoylglutathione lyase family enzyme